MAKRKTSTEPQVADEVKTEGGYHIGQWSGQPHYQCRFCMFDTFDRVAILNHLVNEHNSMSALEELYNQGAPTQPAKETDNGTTDFE